MTRLVFTYEPSIYKKKSVVWTEEDKIMKYFFFFVENKSETMQFILNMQKI